ncbi:GspE/PulE family protein [Pseudoneobacillus sp. C159]
MVQQRKRLGDLLVRAGLITEQQLSLTLKEKSSNQKLGDALLERGYITEQQLMQELSVQLGIPHISLYQYSFDTRLFNLVSKEVAKRNNLIPIRKEGDKLFVAMSDPMDYYAIDDLRLTTGLQIEPVIATKDEIVKAINKNYDDVDSEFDEFIEQIPVANRATEERNNEQQDSPVIRLVNSIFSNAVTNKASDIHIDPQEKKVVVRYRIDGVLRIERVLPKQLQSVVTARIKVLASLDITEYRVPLDGRIKIRLDHHTVDMRVSTIPTVYGEKIVIRILDLGNAISDIENMGYNKLNLKRFINMINKPTGMVLITGPTGSGKSSTLYSALNQLNSPEVNIVTIEDPVEYQIEGINQIQVNPGVGMTFAKGLRSILRQDPNIIMVGEIRDKETAEVSIRASLTGHLVLSTLHTNDSIGTISRLIDMGIEPFLVASSLGGIVAQRLVRKVCRDCRTEQEPTLMDKEIFAKRGIVISKVVRGKGCSACNMSGYKGRIALHEVLVIDDEMRRIVMTSNSDTELKKMAIANKTVFLIDDGLLKVKQGLTTTEEVLKVAYFE